MSGASMRCHLSGVLRLLGHSPESRTAAEGALAIFQSLGDRRGIARAWLALALWFSGEHERGGKLLERALATSRELEDERQVLYVLGLVSIFTAVHSDADHAWALGREVLQLDPDNGHCLRAESLLELNAGNYARAEASCDRALRSARTSQHAEFIGWTLRQHADIAFAQQDYASAYSYAQESCRVFRKLAMPQQVMLQLCHLGTIAALRGDHVCSREHWTEAEAEAVALSVGWGVAYSRLGVVDLDLVDGALASATRDLQHVGRLPLDERRLRQLERYVTRCGRLATLQGVHGDGVNVAARVQGLAVAGSVLISGGGSTRSSRTIPAFPHGPSGTSSSRTCGGL